LDGAHDFRGRTARHPGERVGEVVLEERQVGVARLGHPVGIEEQHVARVELEIGPPGLDVVEQAERQPVLLQDLHPAVGPHHGRPGMPAAPDADLDVASPLTQERQRGGDEAVVVVLRYQHLVSRGEYLVRRLVHAGERADGVPGGGRHRGGVLSLAADIAHRDGPAVARLEDVVEVAADLLELGGTDVGGGELEPGHGGQAVAGQPRGQQAGLQCLGHLGALPEHPVHPDGDRQVPAEFLRQPEVGDAERPLVGQPGERQRPVAGRAVRDRHADHGGRAEHHQQRHALGGPAERGRVVRVREQHRLAGGVHLGGHRFRLGIGRAGHTRELVRLAGPGARRELAQQAAAPFDVDEHPVGDVARQQPGAPLQGDRLAERAVVEQHPGHRRHRVKAARHRGDGGIGRGVLAGRPVLAGCGALAGCAVLACRRVLAGRGAGR
jgi:hypothetical protein